MRVIYLQRFLQIKCCIHTLALLINLKILKVLDEINIFADSNIYLDKFD